MQTNPQCLRSLSQYSETLLNVLFMEFARKKPGLIRLGMLAQFSQQAREAAGRSRALLRMEWGQGGM